MNNNMAKLTKEDVLAIPELLKTMQLKEIARKYNVSNNSICRWVAILKKNGFTVETKRGRKPLLNKIKKDDIDTDFILPRAEETTS